MTIKSDKWIINKSLKEDMISPFSSCLEDKDHEGKKILSYGTSSYGYDARCSNEFISFSEISIFDGYVDCSTIINPKKFNHLIGENIKVEGFYDIPPREFVLTSTIEYFKIPENVLVVCVGKSSYARCGLIVNVTPLEPGWEGNVTIELHNTTNLPIRVYPNEGICQFLFFESDEKCMTSYADRKGKYQGQTGITLPRI